MAYRNIRLADVKSALPRFFKIISCLLIFASCSYAAHNWPGIAPEAHQYHVILPTATPNVSLTIRTPAGSPAYTIECGTLDTPTSSFAYSGEFECLLQTVPPNYSFSTYFTENPHQDRDWESRARFFADEVADPCGEIPDFGRIRTFSLRGMKVTLTMSNITFSSQGKGQTITAFDFLIRVENDSTATTQIAKPPIPDAKWRELPCMLDRSVSVHFH
jgi:hypothetical protein